MYLHKEGKSIALGTLLVLLLIHFTTIKYTSLHYLLYTAFAALSTLLYAWILYFFRVPHRAITLREGCVLAPADGKVVVIQEVYENEYFKDKRIQISVFMSPLNVHQTRSPISGMLTYFKYHPGKYLVAWHPKSSTKNERTSIVVENAQGRQLLFRQIAGFMARRIKFYPKVGDYLQQGIKSSILKATTYINDAFIDKNLQSIKYYGSYVDIIGLCHIP